MHIKIYDENADLTDMFYLANATPKVVRTPKFGGIWFSLIWVFVGTVASSSMETYL